MKNYKKSILIVAVLLTSKASFGQTVIIDNQVFTRDTVIKSERIVFRTGGKVRIKDAKHITFIANVIEVQNAFVIDGRGEAGVNGVAMGDWSTSPTSVGLFGNGHHAHDQYVTSISDGVTGGAHGNAGSNGGNGAIIFIQFKTYEGQNGGLGSLNCLTEGGKGGSGGKGITLHCTDHPSESFTKPSGINGVDGLPGKYTFQQIQ